MSESPLKTMLQRRAELRTAYRECKDPVLRGKLAKEIRAVDREIARLSIVLRSADIPPSKFGGLGEVAQALSASNFLRLDGWRLFVLLLPLVPSLSCQVRNYATADPLLIGIQLFWALMWLALALLPRRKYKVAPLGCAVVAAILVLVVLLQFMQTTPLKNPYDVNGDGTVAYDELEYVREIKEIKRMIKERGRND